MDRFFSRAAPRRGSVAVEFGLTLPILAVILCGVLDYGWYFLTQTAVLNAVKDGVRLGVAAPYGVDPVPIAQDAAVDILEASNLDCGTGCSATAAHRTDAAGYEVLTLSLVRPFTAPAGLIPTPDTQDATFEMVLEHQDLTWYGW
ncbi:MAG: pilus assembly protein [Deltaproteobacteria bacterium]|nr:pilus assembly protein [Deltaproteobacteria bacterium]